MGSGSWNPFRGKKRTRTSYYTDVISTKVMDDNLLQETKVKLALEKMKKGYGGKEYVLNFGNTGAAQFFQYYLKGKYDYVAHLPESGVSAISIPLSNVQTVINTVAGETVYIINVEYAPLIEEDWIEYRLQELNGYNVGTNSVTLPVYNDSGALIGNFEFIYNSYSYISSSNTFSVVLKTSDEKYTKTFSIPAFNSSRSYYLVEYTLPSLDRTKYWIYDPTTNTYPGLAQTDSASFQFESYPVTMFRNSIFSMNEYNINSKVVHAGNKSETVYRPPTITKERYESTKEILDALNIDIEELIENVEENGDIDKVQDAFLVIGISPSNKAPIVSKALFEIFDYVYTNIVPTTSPLDDREDGVPGKTFDESIKYYASFNEDPYNQILSWIPFVPTVANEVIGSLGTYTHSIAKETLYRKDYSNWYYSESEYEGAIYRRIHKDDESHTVLLDSKTGKYWAQIRIGWSGSGDDASPIYDPRQVFINRNVSWGYNATMLTYTPVETKSFVIKYQVTNTQVKTIRLSDVRSEQTISRDKYTGVVEQDVDDDSLILPLPVKIVESFSYMEQTDLFAASVHLVFYAAEKHTITYYRDGWFQAFCKIIAIVICIVIQIFTANASTPLTVVVMAAIMAMVVATVVLTIVIQIMTKITGNSLVSSIVGAVAAAVAAYYTGGAMLGNLDTSSFMTAPQLVSTASEIINTYINEELAAIQAKISSIQSAVESLQETYASMSQQYEDILKSFSTSLDSSFMVSLSVDNKITNTDGRPYTFSPSLVRKLSIDGYRDYNALYVNPIDTFFNTKGNLGIIDID